MHKTNKCTFINIMAMIINTVVIMIMLNTMIMMITMVMMIRLAEGADP